MSQFRWTVLLPRTKLVHLRHKIVATFTENLVQNLRSLVFFSEKKSKWPKIG